MANKNRTMLILGVILLIALMAGQEKKEAVVTQWVVTPGQQLSIIGELVVKDNANFFLPGTPAKVHWYICSDIICNNIINNGYKTLEPAIITDLNTRLTSQFKTTRYDITLTVPSTSGFYWYHAVAETSSNLPVTSIYEDIGTHNFEVLANAIIPCGLGYNTETVTISHGIIRVTVETKYSGNQPNCIFQYKNDIDFEVLCDSEYTANVNGRQSTCTLVSQPSTCTDTDGGQNYLQAGDVTADTGGVLGPATTHDTCLNDGITAVEQYCSGNTNLESTKNCRDYGATWACSDRKCVNIGTTCTIDENSWSPDPSTVCQATGFIQTSNCDTTKMNVGTSTSGSCQSPSHLACVNNACALIAGTGANECATIGVACGTVTLWSPLTSSKACGESFTQTSNLGTTRLATGIACESGSCNLETGECEEEEDEEEFDFGKYIPFIIIFFAFIIGMKMLKSPWNS